MMDLLFIFGIALVVFAGVTGMAVAALVIDCMLGRHQWEIPPPTSEGNLSLVPTYRQCQICKHKEDL